MGGGGSPFPTPSSTGVTNALNSPGLVDPSDDWRVSKMIERS